ncbi:hypothetical protein MJ581_23360 [Escherichia coli]|nr:hypothetical protein MJ581_23360 [Escherichia coli]
MKKTKRFRVYDTSGPYGDPQIAINVQQGLANPMPAVDRCARRDTEKNLPCAVPITLKRDWQMMVFSTSYVLAAY